MLSKVEVRNAQGSLLTLLLEDPSAYFVKEIEGLDPVKTTIVTSSFAQLDGTQYHASKRESRNVTLKLGYLPDHVTTTVGILRKALYRWFMKKSSISLRFYEDELVVEVTGRVESMVAPLFAKIPEANVSIICFDPDFLALDTVTVEGDSVSDATQTLIEYEGTVDTGVLFQMNVNRALSEFTIYHTPPDGVLRQTDVTGDFETGDIIKISSVPGSKSATLTRSGTESSILYTVSPQSNWIALDEGDNYIRVYATGDPIPYTITYTDRYGAL